MASFTKVLSQKTEKELNYSPSKNILEELQLLEKQKGWTIFESLKVLVKGDADSFSFTKDNPYNYFYARIANDNLVLKIKTVEYETEFRIPIQEFAFC